VEALNSCLIVDADGEGCAAVLLGADELHCEQYTRKLGFVHCVFLIRAQVQV